MSKAMQTGCSSIRFIVRCFVCEAVPAKSQWRPQCSLLISQSAIRAGPSRCWSVRLTATSPARLFGLYPRKGSIAPGFDADLVLWDPGKRVTLTNALMQHAIDYTPYEGMEVTGWPVATVLRGRVAMRDGVVQGQPGSGQFLARGAYDLIRPRGVLPDGFDASAFRYYAATATTR
jgi:dihydropyrimidinase